MAKARRDQFEDQLRDLQKDISNLSHKLAIPAASNTNSFHQPSFHSMGIDEEVTQNAQRSFNSGLSNVYTSSDKGEKLAQFMQEAHIAKREKDDAVYRLEQVRAENEEMRKSLQEAVRLKSDFEHLKQDYESVKVSLESSERIRKQQKELIHLLQRSHSIAVASDTGSIISFNSISTISHKGEAAENSTSRRPADLSSASLAAENREWLNRSINFPPAPVISENGGGGLDHVSKSSRRKSTSTIGANHSSVANTSIGSSRPSTTGALSSPASAASHVKQSATPGSGVRTKSAKSGGAKLRKKKAGGAETAEYLHSASLSDHAYSYSSIIGMNHSLVPNRHGEAVDGRVHRTNNMSAYDVDSNASQYSIPVRQSVESLNNSTHSTPGGHVNLVLNSGQSPSSLHALQAGGYVPGTYVPGLGTPTLRSHHLQQERFDMTGAGRPPRHPFANGASPAATPTSRAAPSVHVPSVPRESFMSSSPYGNAPVEALPASSSAVKRAGTKAKARKVQVAPTTPNSVFVRRIPSASPARPAKSSGQSKAPPTPVSRHSSPNVRSNSAPGASTSSTFGVSRRIL